jgi:hypothetical protein
MPITKLKNGQLPDTLSSKTVDNTNAINTTTTNLKITGGTNGQVLSTDGSGNLSWTTAGGLGAPTFEKTKTANETVTSSTTLQDDDHLFQSLTSGKTYYWELVLLVSRSNTTNTPVLKIAIDANSTGYWGGGGSLWVSTLATSTNVSDTAVISTNVGIPTRIIFQGTSKPSSTTTLQVRWAQNVSVATGLILYAGSRLTIWEVA